MEGGLDNVACEVDTERFNLKKNNGRTVEVKKQLFKDFISIFLSYLI